VVAPINLTTHTTWRKYVFSIIGISLLIGTAPLSSLVPPRFEDVGNQIIYLYLSSSFTPPPKSVGYNPPLVLYPYRVSSRAGCEHTPLTFAILK